MKDLLLIDITVIVVSIVLMCSKEDRDIQFGLGVFLMKLGIALLVLTIAIVIAF